MKKLYEFFKNVYSQNGEDGIIEEIFNTLKIKNGVVLEIGAWDGFYLSNTANIWSNNKNFKAVLIESTDNLNVGELESKFDNVNCFLEMASLDNGLEKILNKSKFEINNDNFVLASIDIDGDDLNVTKSLGKYKPVVLVIESNGSFINEIKSDGSSITEIVEFGNSFGYEFIGMSGVVNQQVGNIFFIRKDFKDYFEITKLEWFERGVLTSGGVEYK
jgi:hypothetical protein